MAERREHLHGELRQAVAEARQRQVLEDHVGRAAVGGRCLGAHGSHDQRVGILPLVARIPAPGNLGRIEQVAVGPDAADAGDRPLAQGQREGGGVEIFGGGDGRTAALAAALCGGAGLLAEVGGPHDVAGNAQAAVDPRDDGALGGRRDAKVVEPRALDALGRRDLRDEPAVEEGSCGGADDAAEGGPRQAEHGAAHRPADSGADGAQKKRCHGRISAFGVGKEEGEGGAPAPALA